MAIVKFEVEGYEQFMTLTHLPWDELKTFFESIKRRPTGLMRYSENHRDNIQGKNSTVILNFKNNQNSRNAMTGLHYKLRKHFNLVDK